MTPEEFRQHQLRYGRQVAALESPGALLKEGVDRSAKRTATKYKNERTETEHGKFPSKKQAKRYGELALLEKAGKIRNLRKEVTYTIVINDVRVTAYRADAVYEELTPDGWTQVVEDTKGFITPEYKLKRSLMRAVFGITIRET